MHLREPDADDPRGSLRWEDGCRLRARRTLLTVTGGGSS